MRRPLSSWIASVALTAAALAGQAADASTPKLFRQTTAADFQEGEATSSMILPTGEVVPGLKPTAIAADAAFVWCAATSPDGKVAYFGTGDQGRVYAVDVDGKQTAARQLAALDAPWVTALAVRADGTLVAGTTPGGRLFSIEPKTGRTRLLATLAADHVWALAIDGNTGVVYAGTGSPGKIIAVDAGGRPRELWDSGDKHVVSLLQADDRHLLAGTSDQAILYRVALDGRAEAVADFDAEEVRAIGKAAGATYVAVNDFERAGAAPTAGGPPAAHGTRITAAPSGSPASAGALPRPGQRKAKSALYRLDADGRMEQVFTIADSYMTALAFDADGRVYVGSGADGRVYRVDPDRTAALALDLPERQALALVRAGGGLLVGTGDVGAIYRATPAAAKQATYLSRVLDAEFRARWGVLRWRGAHGLGVETRSGNTAHPDATWTPFGALDATRATADGGAGRVASPPARYVQYRVTFGGADARLDGLTLAYLAQNQRARVTEIGLADAAAAGAATPAAGTGTPVAAPIAARAHSAVLKLRWKVDNPDGDDLDYRLSFREANEAVWRPLGGPDPLTKTDFDWNTDGLPDGSYVVRVVASDERVEPRERALDASLTSAPLLIDNRKPEVLGLAIRYPFVSGRARDSQSPLTALEYAVDGGDWRVLAPIDGICDDLVEAFTLKLPPLTPGPHAVTVRAWDSADNVGAAATTVEAK